MTQPAAALPGPNLGTHLKRAVDWNVREIDVTEREHQELITAGVVESRLQQLLVWRRSSLLMAIPVLALTVILSASEALEEDTAYYTSVGVMWLWMPVLALTIMPIVSAVVISRWTELGATSRWLVLGWVGSIALTLIAALIPIDYILDIDRLRAEASFQELESFDAQLFTVRLAFAVTYAMTLLPTVISVPGGVLKGAARVKSIFPAAQIPGWFLVAVAPFYSLFMIVVFVLIEQLVGNLLLVLGIALLAFAPWLYVIHRSTYWRPMTAQAASVELAKASKTGGFITLGGLACVAIFMFTAKVGSLDVVGSDEETSVFSYVQVARTVAEVISRSFVTTVVLCLVFLNMVFREWQIGRTISDEVREEHEVEMATLARFDRQRVPKPPRA